MEIEKYYAGWRVSFDKINPFGVLISSLGKEIRISDRSVIRQARAIYDSMSVTGTKESYLPRVLEAGIC